MEKNQDIALVERMKRGDAEAFDELYEKYWEKLYMAAYNRLGNEADAKDCVQELFVALWQKKATLNITSSVGAYLFTALKNRIFSLFREQAVRGKHERHFSQSGAAQAEEDAFGKLNLRELNHAIEEEIRDMPEKMREIFILSRKKGWSTEQIALTLSVSRQTVRNQVSRAIARLRRRIDRHKEDR